MDLAAAAQWRVAVGLLSLLNLVSSSAAQSFECGLTIDASALSTSLSLTFRATLISNEDGVTSLNVTEYLPASSITVANTTSNPFILSTYNVDPSPYTSPTKSTPNGFLAFLNNATSGANTCNGGYLSPYSPPYIVKWGGASNVAGYASSKTAPVTFNYRTNTVSITAPFADASFPPWNGVPGPALCCHSDEAGNGTVIAIRLFNKATYNASALVPNCNEDLSLASSYFLFQVDCGCTYSPPPSRASGRKILQTS